MRCVACWNWFFWGFGHYEALILGLPQITCEQHLCGLNSPTWFRCRIDLVNPQLGANWFSSKAAVGYLSRANKSLHVFPIAISYFQFFLHGRVCAKHFCLFLFISSLYKIFNKTRGRIWFDMRTMIWFHKKSICGCVAFYKRDDSFDINIFFSLSLCLPWLWYCLFYWIWDVFSFLFRTDWDRRHIMCKGE